MVMTFNIKKQPEEILLKIFKILDENDLENLLTIPSLKKVFEKYEGDFPPPSSFPAGYQMWINANLETIQQGEKTETVQNLSFEIKLGNQELVFRNTSFQKIKRYLKPAGSVDIILEGTVPDFFQVDNMNYRKLKNHLRNCGVKRIRISMQRVSGVQTDIALLFPETTEVSCCFNVSEFKSEPSTVFGLNFSVLCIIGFLPVQIAERLLSKEMRILDFGCEEPLSLDKFIEEWQLGQREFISLVLSFRPDVCHGFVNKEYVRVIDDRQEKLKLTVERKSNHDLCLLKRAR